MALAKTPPLTAGDIAEARVAQVWFWEGYFTRAGIDLQNEYGPELIQVTDLDLVAVAFGPTLESHRVIGETKTGTGKSAPKPLDRIVWLAGLQRLVDAKSAELTIAAKAVPRVRELGRHLNVTVQSLDDLKSREDGLAMAKVADTGSQGETAFAMRRDVKGFCADDTELSQAFRFLTSRVWHIDAFSAVKQTIGVIEQLGKRYTPALRDDDLTAVRWLIAEAISVFALNLTKLAGEITPRSDLDWTEFVRERLADGIVPAAKMRQLSPRIDKYIAGVLATVKAPREVIVGTVGAFDLKPPTYSDSLAELGLRLKRSGHGASFARHVDFIVYERMVRNRSPKVDVAERLGVTSAAPFAVVAAFLKQFAGLPDDFYGALTAAVGDPSPMARRAAAQLIEAGNTDRAEPPLFDLDKPSVS